MVAISCDSDKNLSGSAEVAIEYRVNDNAFEFFLNVVKDQDSDR